jgi:hypothetical protein
MSQIPPPPSPNPRRRLSKRIVSAIFAIILISIVVVASYVIFLQPKKLQGSNELWWIYTSEPYPAHPANADVNFSVSDHFNIDKDTPKITIKVKFLAVGLYPNFIADEAPIQNELRLQMELRNASNYQVIATRYCFPTAYWPLAYLGEVNDIPINTGEFYITFYTPNAQYPRNWYYQIEVWGHY